MPKISIVIPVHNIQDHLRECLDSVVSQTLEDIEVICIDDHSEDASPGILREYAQRDSRIQVITFLENKGASQARRDGVFASTGEYIMFLDADDAIAHDACERLYETVERDPVDILHFGTAITNESNLPPERIKWMEDFVKPYDGKLEGRSILDGAFSYDRLYNFSLWDKLYAAHLCKKSFARVRDGRFPKAQDKYAYFILSYFARTYRGIPSEVLYSYHFGRGATGHHILSLTAFEKYCAMALVADAIREFLVEEDALHRYEALYARVRNQLLHDCGVNWNRHLRTEDKSAGFDLMLAYWEAPEVVGKIAELNWSDQGHIARHLERALSIAREPREVRVIGTYYHRFANGGVQRILSSLIKLWVGLGFEVVLFTDVPPSSDDYDLPEGVRRVILTSALEIEPSTYVERAREIEAAIKEHGIDVIVYHAWVSRVMLWDLLITRSTGAAFITHCHSVFSQPLRTIRTYFADMPSVYHLCDAIIALSEVDRTYWSNFNDNIVCVVNPLTFDLADLESSKLEAKNVLWLGRMSDEKRPHDALRIFAKVLEEEPDSKLFMVGGSPDQAYMDSLRALTEELGIHDDVVLCGFQKDVLPFYSTSSVLLMTSEFEGFPLTLSESQSAGIPCVMYDLPYLTLTSTKRGFLAVEVGDINAAADAVVSLLRDHDYRRSLGREARANVEELARFDFAGVWRGVFEGLSRPTPDTALDETTRIMWETLTDHYRTGAVSCNSEISQLKRKLAVTKRAAKKGHRARQELRRVRLSWSFRVGYWVTSAPRKIRRLFRSAHAVEPGSDGGQE